MIGIISTDITVRCQGIDWASISQSLETSTGISQGTIQDLQGIGTIDQRQDLDQTIGKDHMRDLDQIHDQDQMFTQDRTLSQDQTCSQDLVEVQDQVVT